MLIGPKLTIVWAGLLALGYGSDSVVETNGFSETDGAFYTDDAVILNGKRISNVFFLFTNRIDKIIHIFSAYCRLLTLLFYYLFYIQLILNLLNIRRTVLSEAGSKLQPVFT